MGEGWGVSAYRKSNFVWVVVISEFSDHFGYSLAWPIVTENKSMPFKFILAFGEISCIC